MAELVEGARFEIVFRVKPNVGSNPTSSAILRRLSRATKDGEYLGSNPRGREHSVNVRVFHAWLSEMRLRSRASKLRRTPPLPPINFAMIK